MDVPITESSATLAPKNQGPKPSARFWIGLLTLVQIIVCCLTINVIFLWYSKQFATTTITPIFLYFLAGFSVFVNLGVLKTSIDLKIKNMVYPKGHQVMSIGASLALLCYIVMEFLMIFYFFIVIRPYMSLEHQDYVPRLSLLDWTFYEAVTYLGSFLRILNSLGILHFASPPTERQSMIHIFKISRPAEKTKP